MAKRTWRRRSHRGWGLEAHLRLLGSCGRARPCSAILRRSSRSTSSFRTRISGAFAPTFAPRFRSRMSSEGCCPRGSGRRSGGRQGVLEEVVDRAMLGGFIMESAVGRKPRRAARADAPSPREWLGGALLKRASAGVTIRRDVADQRQIRPKCRSASSMASRFSGGHGSTRRPRPARFAARRVGKPRRALT